MHDDSFTAVGVWETLVKVDGICDSCRNVRSWLTNFKHLSSPWMNSVNARSLWTTGGACIVSNDTLGACKSKEDSALVTWKSCCRSWKTVACSVNGVGIHCCLISVIYSSYGGDVWISWSSVFDCVYCCPQGCNCHNSSHRLYHSHKVSKNCAVEKCILFVMSPMCTKICQILLLKCKNKGVAQSRIKHNAR